MTKARRRLLEIIGADHTSDHYPCSLVPTLAQAHELLLLADDVGEYEVGYWDGGNYSILCDSIIWPMWHPPFRPHSAIWRTTSSH